MLGKEASDGHARDSPHSTYSPRVFINPFKALTSIQIYNYS